MGKQHRTESGKTQQDQSMPKHGCLSDQGSLSSTFYEMSWRAGAVIVQQTERERGGKNDDDSRLQPQRKRFVFQGLRILSRSACHLTLRRDLADRLQILDSLSAHIRVQRRILRIRQRHTDGSIHFPHPISSLIDALGRTDLLMELQRFSCQSSKVTNRATDEWHVQRRILRIRQRHTKGSIHPPTPTPPHTYTSHHYV